MMRLQQRRPAAFFGIQRDAGLREVRLPLLCDGADIALGYVRQDAIVPGKSILTSRPESLTRDSFRLGPLAP